MRKPMMLGADREADAILNDLPRHLNADGYPKFDPNAWVYIDGSGRLCILPLNGGWLGIKEDNLVYVDGDFSPF